MSDTAQGSRAGSQFGRYHLTRLLGRGGMGEVYEAEDTAKDRVVALKLLSAVLSQDPVFRERLQREARTAGRLHDPHVVPIHDYGEIDGQLFLDMRLIQGSDLSTLLKKSGALTPSRAVDIVRQAASALDAAHAMGVTHRDVKPENILVTREDFVYLVDFGIANATADERLTQMGSAVGTWKYSAPERFTNGEVGYSVDIYALACVLYECLTGKPPYRADSAGMLITSHLMDPIPQPSKLAPGIPAAFDEVITRGMAKDPKDRYASAGELARAANQALIELPPTKKDEATGGSKRSAEPPGSNGGRPQSTAPTQRPPQAPPQARPQAPPQAPPQASPQAPPQGPPPAPPQAPARSPAHGAAHGAGDTGRIQPPAGAPHPGGPSFAAGGGSWPPRPLPPVQPRRPMPRQRKPEPNYRPWAVAVAALVTVVALIVWLANRSHPEDDLADTSESESTTSSVEPTTTTSDADAQARLSELLPPGYAPNACKPITPTAGASAKVSCGQNNDPDGPSSATYAVYPDNAALEADFNDIVTTTAVIVCPGGIQSPGPWHHATTPDKASGMLLCGTQRNRPTVVWTDEAKLLISVVQGVRGPNLEGLYAWWSSHS